MTGRQLALGLAFRPQLGRDDFVVAPGNAQAIGWIDAWPNWPQGGLVLYGPPAAGKSHLVCIWQKAAGARVVATAALSESAVADLSLAPLALEDAPGIGDEKALLHLLNMLRERKREVLITAANAPARWPLKLPDLRSRLLALPAVAVAAPDDALLRGVLAKLFADRQMHVGEEVLDYILTHAERSLANARALVAAIDDAAMATQRKVGVALVREVLQTFHAENVG
jgi:chromosomal replication initiation ATPase DnaA